MKKTAFILSLSVLTLIYGKYDPNIRPRVHNDYLPTSNVNAKITSQIENSLVQLRNTVMTRSGMTQMKYIYLQKTLGNVNIASIL